MQEGGWREPAAGARSRIGPLHSFLERIWLYKMVEHAGTAGSLSTKSQIRHRMTTTSAHSRKLNSSDSLLCPAAKPAFWSLFGKEEKSKRLQTANRGNGTATRHSGGGVWGSHSCSPSVKITELLLPSELGGRRRVPPPLRSPFFFISFRAHAIPQFLFA